MTFVVLVIVLAVVMFVVWRVSLMAWRFFRGDLPAEPAGSEGRQLFGRRTED